jgi:hypothetical protein
MPARSSSADIFEVKQSKESSHTSKYKLGWGSQDTFISLHTAYHPNQRHPVPVFTLSRNTSMQLKHAPFPVSAPWTHPVYISITLTGSPPIFSFRHLHICNTPHFSVQLFFSDGLTLKMRTMQPVLEPHMPARWPTAVKILKTVYTVPIPKPWHEVWHRMRYMNYTQLTWNTVFGNCR